MMLRTGGSIILAIGLAMGIFYLILVLANTVRMP